MDTHHKKQLFRLSRIKYIDYPEPTIMSHLLDNHMYSILAIESKIDDKLSMKSHARRGEKYTFYLMLSRKESQVYLSVNWV